MKGKPIGKVLIIILVAIFLGIFDLPADTKAPLVGWAPDYLRDQHVHLGLDLQGGAELDYKIDLRKVPLEDQQSIVEGVKEVINKRVNSLGVSEPNIFVSEIAGESHIIVDLAGVNVEEAKNTIGKTIQLEFKERKDEIDPNEKQEIEKKANDALQKIIGGEDFALVGQEEEQANPEQVTYQEFDFTAADAMNEELAEKLGTLNEGDVYNGTIETSGDFTMTANGELVEVTGLNIVKLVEVRETEKTTDVEKKVNVSHILVAYSGAERADETITRSKEEAETYANDLLKQIQDEEAEFSDLAKNNNDDSSAASLSGVLISPAGEGQYTEKFEEAALALTEKDELTLVETEFGYHIIQAGTITGGESKTETINEYKYEMIFFSTIPTQWQETGLTGEHFVHADVAFNQVYQPYVSIQFNEEGAELFAELTERNIGKPLAIFVGGQLISAPTVRAKIQGGSAQIEGNFSIEEASELARDLNTGAIPAPIVLAGQYTIGAELGADALAKSLWAGLIGLLILAVYMTLYYRLPGILAVIALSIYAVILLFLIQSALSTILSIIIAVGMFIFLMMRILNSKENGWEKLLTSILAVFALFFIVFLLANPIVLTLAGVAGVILSIGMAVDANVLIFERVKEEIRDGRPLGSAIDVGFNRAWNSIRDSNFSSLITCAILFYFGSSIIQGFAFNLAAGILVSMFTAITITKTFLKLLVGTKFAKSSFLLGAKPTQHKKKQFDFIKNSKKWFSFSGVLVAIAIVSIFAFGLRMGIDFTGGTLMQIKFEQEVAQEDLKIALEEIGNEVYGTESSIAEGDGLNSETSAVLSPSDEVVDFSTASIIWSSDGYIIKTKYISTDVHDQILEKL